MRFPPIPGRHDSAPGLPAAVKRPPPAFVNPADLPALQAAYRAAQQAKRYLVDGHPGYIIDGAGRIWDCRAGDGGKGREVPCYIHRGKRLVAYLYSLPSAPGGAARRHCRSVAALMAAALPPLDYTPPPAAGGRRGPALRLIYLDGDRGNCAAENLAWHFPRRERSAKRASEKALVGLIKAEKRAENLMRDYF